MTQRAKTPDPIEPHPVNLEAKKPKRATGPKSSEHSAKERPGLPAPHIGRPVRNCTCMSCELHRKLNRQALRDAAYASLYADVIGPNGMTVETGRTATEALKRALGAN